MHGFSDSSEATYTAVVYLRVKSENEENFRILIGKSKISPTTKVWLELCGAVLLSRLLAFIKSNLATLNIFHVTAWTDYGYVTMDKNIHGKTKDFYYQSHDQSSTNY